MQLPLIFNIQKFSLHDGPGIRTTIFFKGCPLKCLWCHNPESQNYQAEWMRDQDRKQKRVGREYTVSELVKIAQADQIFYDQSGGGVTLSGGEVMTQDMDFVEALVRELNRVGVSVAIDTCGHAPQENFARLLPHTDLFLYDVKFIDSDQHHKYTGAANDLILNNLAFLLENHAAIDLRLILIDGVNADIGSMRGIVDWLRKRNGSVKQVSLLPYHDFGRDKYKKLDRPCTQEFQKPDEELLAELQVYLKQNGFATKIGG